MNFNGFIGDQTDTTEIIHFASEPAGSHSLVIDETENLLSADFLRDGPDLVIREDAGFGSSSASDIRIVDYFTHETPPDLATPEGSILRAEVVEKLAGPLAAGQYAQAGGTTGSTAIGQVEELTGTATVQRADGTVEPLAVGVPVFQNDVVQTGDGSSISLIFVDETVFTLTEQARMILDELIYDPGSNNNSAIFNLIEGSFVFIAGQVATTGGIDVQTPTATMGIRGTTVRVDIESTNGVTTVEVALLRDADGGLGTFTISALDGTQLATVSVTESSFVVTSADGQNVDVQPRTPGDIASDQVIFNQAVSAFQSATERAQQGGDLVTPATSDAAPDEPTDGDGADDGDGDGDTGDDGQDAAPDDAGGEQDQGNNTNSGGIETDFASIEDGTGPESLAGPDGADGGTDGGIGISPPTGQSSGSPDQSTQSSANIGPQSIAIIIPDTEEDEEPEPPVELFEIVFPTIDTPVAEDGQVILTGFDISGPPGALLIATITAGSSITLVPGSGVEILAGSDVNSDFVVIQGTAVQINFALNGDENTPGLLYEPSPDEDVEGFLTISISDGVAPPLTSTLIIPVTGVNDAPVINIGSFVPVIEGNLDTPTPVTFNLADIVTATDVDAGETPIIDASSITVITAASSALPNVVFQLVGTTITVDTAQADGLDEGEVAQLDVTFDIVSGPDRVPQSTTIIINGVNDAPIADDASFSGDEDNDITGTLTASDVDGDNLTFSPVTQPANGTVVINADGTFTFTPDLNFNGTDSFTFNVSDGTTSDTGTVDLTITAVDDPPSISVVDFAPVPEGDVGVLSNVEFDLNTILTASDVDDGETPVIDPSSIQISVAPGSDFLSIANFAPTATGFIVDTANFDILDSGEFGLFDVQFIVDSGPFSSPPQTTRITIVGENDAPMIDGVSTSVSYVENAAPVTINTSLSIVDTNSTEITGAEIAISNGFQTGDSLNFLDTPTITGSYDTATGILTLTGTDTLANFAAALNSITYESSSDNLSDAPRTISITVTDGVNTSDAFTTTIDPTSVNDAPEISLGLLELGVNLLPAETETLGGQSGIQIIDPDGNNAVVFVSLVAETNQVAVDSTIAANLNITVGAEGGGSTLMGTIADLNAFFATPGSINYTSPTGFMGQDDLTVTVNDLGNSGSGGAQITSVIVPITSGTNTNTPTDGPDVVAGTAAADFFLGGFGNDTLSGDDGNDQLFGEDGDFDVLEGGRGADLLDGGGDFDFGVGFRGVFDHVDYRNAPAGITVHLGEGFARDGTGSLDRIASIEGVFTTAFDDVVIGGNLANDGFEIFRASSGNDFFDGGSGFDRVRYLEHGQEVFVNLSDEAQTFDTTIGQSGVLQSVTVAAHSALDDLGFIDQLINIESIQGSNGDDILIGGDGNEQFRAQGGDDFIDGGDGFDEVDYIFTFGPQGITVDLSAQTATDTFGNTDTIINIEQVRGSLNNDSITGDGNNNVFRISGGSDAFDGGGGTNTVTFSNSIFAGGGFTLTEPFGASINLSSVDANLFGGLTAAGTAIDQFGNVLTLTNIQNITGSEQSDYILGNDQANVLLGGEGGIDFIDGGAGADIIDGGGDLDVDIGVREAFDHVLFNSATEGVFVNLSDETRTIDGVTVQGGTALDGTGSIDIIRNIEGVFGTIHDDIIIGGNPENDFFEIFRSSGGNDFFDGGTGSEFFSNRVRYLEDPGSVLVNLSNMDETLNGTLVAAGTAVDGFGDIDTLVNINSIQGTNLADFVIGSDGDEQFRLQGGNDFVDGRGGTNILSFDFTFGFQGVNVNLAMGTAVDTFGDTDTLVNIQGSGGSAFDDTLIGDANNNTFIISTGGFDTIDAGGGDQDLFLASFDGLGGSGVVVNGGVFVDLTEEIFSSSFTSGTIAGVENVTGSSESDTLIGDANDNILLGEDGQFDFITGGAGNDFLDGGDDFDAGVQSRGVFDHVLFTNASNGVAVNFSNTTVTANGVTIAAQSAQDGDGGVDTVINFEGVFGSAFDDTLIGGNTDNDEFEIFRSSAGNDYIDGGSGFDRVRYLEDNAAVIVNLSSMTVMGVAAGMALDGFGDLDTLINIESVQGSNFADVLVGNDLDNEFRAQGGNDTINGGGGIDELDFAFTGGFQGATVDLELGTAQDTFGSTDTFTSIENVQGSAFDDIVLGSSVDNTFFISEGNDFYDGRGGIDTIDFDYGRLAGSGLVLSNGVTANLESGGAVGAEGSVHRLENIENIIGSAFNDVLTGDGNANVISGGGGDDILIGNGGADTLSGGDGNDQLSVEFGSFQSVSGGTGDDLLTFTDAGSINLSTLDSSAIDSIESLSIENGEVNTLNISVDDLLQFNSDGNSFLTDALGLSGVDSLLIQTDDGESVHLVSEAGEAWILNSTQSALVDGFDIYEGTVGGSSEVVAALAIDDQAAVTVVVA